MSMLLALAEWLVEKLAKVVEILAQVLKKVSGSNSIGNTCKRRELISDLRAVNSTNINGLAVSKLTQKS
jgi:hypothetical protein